eukprot:gene4424-6056_t
MDMGPSACLRIDDVRVVIGSHKAQLADQAMYRFVGIEPTTQSILVNKSSVHFRADFEPIAGALLICAAPGAMPADTSTLPWKRLRPGNRLDPGIRVTRQTPPTFLLQAWDDPVDDICNSTLYARALDDAGVPSEVHLFARGGHAFALRRTPHAVAMWPALVERWLAEIGVL